jgi:MraZ protein
LATFYGTSTYSIDEKGRLVIPASLRRVDGHKQPLTRFVLVGGLDGCLWLYAEEDWTHLEERLRRLSMGTQKERQFARAFLVGASRVAVDSQGRITIPSSLMSRAGLGKDAVLHGQVGRIELWSPDRFSSAVELTPEDLNRLAEDVLGGLP